MNFKKKVKMACEKVDNHRPEIFTGLGIVTGVAAAVKACKATPEALQLIEDAKQSKKEAGLPEEEQVLSPIETVKAGVKPYIPSLILGGVSISLLIGANRTSIKRTAALSTAYQISQKALSDYKTAVIETIGEKKEKEVVQHYAEKKVEENPPTQGQIVMVGDSDILVLESISGRYFKSNIENIRHAENEANRIMIRDGNVSCNEVYVLLGLEIIQGMGNELGWNEGRDGKLVFDINHVSISPDGKPCLVLTYNNNPKYGYAKELY